MPITTMFSIPRGENVCMVAQAMLELNESLPFSIQAPKQKPMPKSDQNYVSLLSIGLGKQQK